MTKLHDPAEFYHLFGVPTDVARICELAKHRGCPTIEDAVAAIGGRQDGRPLGTFGDFGVFSFEQSKRITAFRGGCIVAKNDSAIWRSFRAIGWLRQHDRCLICLWRRHSSIIL